MAMVNEALVRCQDCFPERATAATFGTRMRDRLEHYRGWLMDDLFWAHWTAELIELYREEGLCGKHAAFFAAHSVMLARRREPEPFAQPDAILR